jgi:hypothetical protein
MELKDRLESELRKPVQSTQDAQRVAGIAEALAELLRASENATRVLGDSGEVPPSNTREDPGLASFTLHDAAERVLERAGINRFHPQLIDQLGDDALRRDQHHQHRAQPGLTGPEAGAGS